MASSVEWRERRTRCIRCGAVYVRLGPAPHGPGHEYGGVCARCIEGSREGEMEVVIVTRHAGAVEWLRRHHPELAEAPVVASATTEVVRGKIVVGNVPLGLAAEAAEVWAIEFDGAPPRGAEFSASDMEAAGARLRRYRVEALGEEVR